MMRAGVFVPQGWRLDLVGIPVEQHWPTITEVAHDARRFGYESVWVYDHFHTVPAAIQEVTYEAWTLMGALAVATEDLRLGQMCTCNSYRMPSYLAKVAASIDVISGGRVEMGIGGGWFENEYLAYGYQFPRPAVRLGELAEGVEIMKRMWTEDAVHFDGKHYQLQGAICQPKPVQMPHIPLWIAGGGEKLTLRIAAQHAAYTNFGGTSAEEFVNKSGILAGHCREVGRDFDEIVRSANFNVVCEADEAAVKDRLAWIVDHFRPLVGDEKAARSGRNFETMAGTPEQLIEKLKPWVDAGLGYMICYFQESAYDRSGIERFAREVLPAL
jgi:F420-dependent oxidoreductase-like protein